jgi:hypothetical protein
MRVLLARAGRCTAIDARHQHLIKTSHPLAAGHDFQQIYYLSSMQPSVYREANNKLTEYKNTQQVVDAIFRLECAKQIEICTPHTK